MAGLVRAIRAQMTAGVARILETPRAMAAMADLAYPQTRGDRRKDFADGQAFEAALMRAAMVDPVVHRAMAEVLQLLEPLGILRQPEMQRRIEAASARAVA